MKRVLIVGISPIIVFIVFYILFHHSHEGEFFRKKTNFSTEFFCFDRLKPLDIECMKALHHKVNIIPIIAKADALTSEELHQMKQNVCQKK